jgi:hypothetical protein
MASVSTPAEAAAPAAATSERHARIVEHWTPERRAAAIPRDLVIDSRGLGYLRKPDRSLTPYGHAVAAVDAPRGATPMARPGGGGSSDTTPPSIGGMDPASGSTIGGSKTFSADVTDASGIKSVSFTVQKSGGVAQSFNAGSSDGTTWTVPLQGFTDGSWSWYVTAKDNGDKGGNTATSGVVSFSVDTGSGSGGSGGGGGGGGGGGTGGSIVTNSPWTAGGDVQTAAGRIYFEMPANAKRKGPWNGYVCSGTVATDGATDRSVIITAAHCVYDDANKAFARNVLFIPNQAGTTGSGTDRNCDNDPIGCWTASFGVVDVNWTTRTFPDNIPWDYAFYVVNNTGAHTGKTASSDALDQAAGSLPVSFGLPVHDTDNDHSDYTHALGYSYSDDPNFMYCAEDMTTEGDSNWWLPSCGLSGGSSGGPWVQPMDVDTQTGAVLGTGPIISVNSWGYTTAPGMAGPKLVQPFSSASCLFGEAQSLLFSAYVSVAAGDAGQIVNCP